MKCPKCGGEMEEGLLGENRASGYGAISTWGKKLAGLGTLEKGIVTKACRCNKCGFVEVYAK